MTMRTIHKIVTVMGGQSAHQAYINKVKTVQAANLLAFWPQDEKTGTNADNAEGTAARDGTYTAVTLNNTTGPFGGPAGLWDGSTSYTNIYSTSLRDAWDAGAKSLGSISVWGKVSGAGVWTDGIARRVIEVGVLNANTNRVLIARTAANNSLLIYYQAGGTADSVTHTTSTTDWFHAVITWDKANDRVRCYFNGAQTGATQTGLGTWAFLLDSAKCAVGAENTTPANSWSGNIAYPAIWSTELTAANVTTLYNGGPI